MTTTASPALHRTPKASLAAAPAGPQPEVAREPVGIHPDHPRVFRFRGRPLALISATEHYGAVINRPFDYERYLADAAAHGMTMTRTFLLFRELQSPQNPCSPCKPESPDYLAPWPRSGPGRALDGEPTYDLSVWNPEYFERLHRFLACAAAHGIVVELTLFSNSYGDHIWALNPLRRENNRQGIGTTAWADYTALGDAPRLERQLAFTRKVVQETVRYDHVVYEICNEPGGGVPGHSTPADVDAWQQAVAAVVREELAAVGAEHLVVGTQAFAYTPRGSAAQNHDLSFQADWLDAVNVHPLPDVSLAGAVYHMGNFMSKELSLEAFRAFTLACTAYPRPCVHDEDNVASCYRDEVGWTIHRKRAWMALLCGAHYDYIDFSITVGSEAGTEASRRGIRSALHHLSRLVHGLDLARARTLGAWAQGLPPAVLSAALGTPDEILLYVADARELGQDGAGEPLAPTVLLPLPTGTWSIHLVSPTTGMASPAIERTSAGEPVSLRLPAFRQDCALHLVRQGA